MCNLVNKTNLVHILVYLSTSTCFWVTMCPSSGEIIVFVRHFVPVILYGWLSGMQGGISFHPAYQMSHKYSYFSWWWAHSRPKHVEIDKYTKNKLCTTLALFTRMYRDTWSTKRKILLNVHLINLQMWKYSNFFFTENYRNCGII